jgi:hypothetical protein
VYVTLSAGVDVERGADGTWRQMCAGEVSCRPSGTSHASRAGYRAVLVAYAWHGDLAAPTWWKHDTTDPSEPRRDAYRR